jgi:hypothetical protein
VVGENLIMLGQPVRVELLDREADRPVQLPPALDQERVVGHVVGQRVLEHVGQLGKDALLIDQLDGLQLAEEFLRAAAHVRDPLEQPAGKFPSDDRRELERLLRGVL